MIEKRTLWAMTVGSGLAVANIYYNQPLPADMGRYFGVPDRRMGLVSMLTQVSYIGLLRSIGGLLRDEPVLRQSCLFGAMGFGAFSTFWTTLAFHLAGSPFHYGSGFIGLFGLVGIVGALAAPVAGRLADRRSARWTIGAGLTCVLLAYLVLYGFGGTVAGMVAGVILLDLGVQSAHISNQSRIYSIRPEARSRMNTAYMVTYFVGGAVGSPAGAWGWGRGGWGGVCLVGLGMTVAGLLAFVVTSGERRKVGDRDQQSGTAMSFGRDVGGAGS